MFSSRNKKNNVYPCKPQFYYIKVGFKGVKILLVCFRDEIIYVSIYRHAFTEAMIDISPLLSILADVK